MGMAKPHMLGAQNENIKRMLGLGPSSVEPGDAEILNPPIPKSTFMRSTSKSGLSTRSDILASKDLLPSQKFGIVNSGYNNSKPKTSSVMDSDSELGTPVSMGRKKPLGSTRAHSLVNRSANPSQTSTSGAGFKPATSQSSFGATSRSKPPIKGGGGAFKTQDEEEMEEFENEEFAFIHAKMELEDKLADFKKK